MSPKPSRKRDDDALAAVRGQPCLICARPSDPCHVRSRGAGGGDESWNLMRLCRRHHNEQHAHGWRVMAYKHSAINLDLRLKGWSFDDFNRLIRSESSTVSRDT